MTEASCAKCHKQQVYVPKAEKLNVAYATYERAGCYACHKTKGFDTNMQEARADPHEDRFEAVAGLGEDLDPQSAAVKPTTWMPRFWYNSNTSSPEDAVRNEVEINAVVAVSVRQHREARVRRQEPAARRRASSGEQIVKRDRLPGLPRRRRRERATRPARAARSASRWRTSATRPPTSGSTTGCAIRSTTTRPPTCRTCGSPTRRSPTWRPT